MSSTKRKGKEGRHAVEVIGLAAPWKAYRSRKSNRVYFFNKTTGETTWQMPDAVGPRPTASSSAPGKTLKRKSGDQRCAGLGVHDEEMMDVDFPPTKKAVDFRFVSHRDCAEEKMDVDFGDAVERFRGETRLVEEDPLEHAHRQHMLLPETTCKAIAVFDTSALLNNIRVFNKTINCADLIAVIPYTVLKELDYLKTSSNAQLKFTAIKVTSTMFEATRQKHPGLFLENSSEALAKLDGFVVEKNDDSIMKCALLIRAESQCRCGVVVTFAVGEHVDVFFITNDRNLALRAISNGLTVYSDLEWMNVLEGDDANGSVFQSRARSTLPVSDGDADVVWPLPSTSAVAMPHASDEKQVRHMTNDGRAGTSRPTRTRNHVETVVERSLNTHISETVNLVVTLLSEIQRAWTLLSSSGSKNSADASKMNVDAARLATALEKALNESNSQSVSVFVDLLVTIHSFHVETSAYHRVKVDKRTLELAVRDPDNECGSQLASFLSRLRDYIG